MREGNLAARVRVIILDFDGVLVESNAAKDRAFADLSALYPSYAETMMAYHMAHYSSPRRMKFEHYVYDVMGRPGDTVEVLAMAAQFSALAIGRVLSAPEVPGARAFLEEFHRLLPVYLASTTPADELTAIIRARGFEASLAGIFGDPPFTKLDAVREVLLREGVAPEEAVLVGDSPADLQVALASGVGFLGRNSGVAFDGIALPLYRDLFDIADAIRPRSSG